jgi:hypothetical protein
MQRILLLLLFTLVFLLSVTQAQKEEDRIIMRDGQEISGRLNFLNLTSVQFDGKLIERSKVNAIIFAGVTTSVAEGDRLEDLVVMRDGRRFSGFVSQVTDQSIIQKDNEFGREKVALIKFASNNRPVLETKPTDKQIPDESGKTEEPKPPTGTVRPEEDSDEDGKKNSKGAKPPWDEITEDCKFKGKINMGPSGGSPYRYNAKGSPQELLPSGYVTCTFFFYVCGDPFFKGHVINVNAGERCPDWNVPYREICCDQWEAVKQKKDPKKLCDPMKDSDCDGTPNDEDDTPAGPIK